MNSYTKTNLKCQNWMLVSEELIFNHGLELIFKYLQSSRFWPSIYAPYVTFSWSKIMGNNKLYSDFKETIDSKYGSKYFSRQLVCER